MAKAAPPVKTRIRANKNTIFWVVGAILIMVLVLIFGLPLDRMIPINNVQPLYGIQNIRFGIDIKGGYDIVFVPDGLGRAPTAAELSSARSIIELRLDAKNITDRDVTIDQTNGRILVRFPLKSTDNFATADANAAILELGATAKLTFTDPSGNVVIDGSNVTQSYAAMENGGPVVVLKLNADGATKFSDATGRLIGQVININMDNKIISSPIVQNQITNGDAIINNMSSLADAKALSDKINAGSLPFSLKAVSNNIISPTLGQGALDVMVKAGLFAFALICLFMILYYRLPGFVAVLALIMQVTGQLLAITIPQFTLTLPGIAGIILSLGMGVDANVIISERVKEEIRAGNSLRFSISAGFQRAFAAVLDGNVTTMFPAILLMVFGSGALLSFGYTLLTGVILNLVTGVTMSRLMTGSLSLYDQFQSTWLYGGRRSASK